MSEQKSQSLATAPERATPEGYTSWPEYWTAQGMPWRRAPEIDEKRQRFLAERRNVEPDMEKGIYPFKGIRLSRADVEWLLATHESDGVSGPVNWDAEEKQEREGLDLRGAYLSDVDLSFLPLARLHGGLSMTELNQAHT